MTEKQIESNEENDSQSPGYQFLQLFQAMHNLNDKLLTINYSKEFVHRYKCPPINRYYFCRQTNSAQQFYTFSCLAAFLLNKLSADININTESFDDPTVTIDTILNASHDLIHSGVHSTNRNKLKLGFGLDIIHLLNALADKVLSETINKNGNNEQITIKGCDDENNNTDDIIDSENADEDNEIQLEDESNYTFIDDKLVEDERDEYNERKEVNIMKSECDSNQWKLEVERVLPQLKLKVNVNNLNEWRNHYNSVHTNYDKMAVLWDQTYNSIQTLSNEIRANEQKINSREKYIRQQLEHILEEWISVRNRVSKIREEYSHVSSGVVNKSQQLSLLSQQIDSNKQEMELFSNKMTDSSPMIVAKKAKDTIKNELIAMELRIGVSVQTLLHERYV